MPQLLGRIGKRLIRRGVADSGSRNRNAQSTLPDTSGALPQVMLEALQRGLTWSLTLLKCFRHVTATVFSMG
jgi:hypothetical protein